MNTCIQKRILNFHLDSFGMVHHGRYLELFEEGRWDYCWRNGLIDEFHKGEIYHVVANITIDYRKKAGFGDMVTIETALHKTTGRSVIFRQSASRKGTVLACADVTNVFLHRADGTSVTVADMALFWNDLQEATA